MKNFKWIIISAVFVLLVFAPVFAVNVVPEWSVRLIDEKGQAIANARIDQWWKDYSYEFWTVEQHNDETLSSDEEGIVTFPARDIRVSAFQFVAAIIRDVVASINRHSSYGPYSHVL